MFVLFFFYALETIDDEDIYETVYTGTETVPTPTEGKLNVNRCPPFEEPFFFYLLLLSVLKIP